MIIAQFGVRRKALSLSGRGTVYKKEKKRHCACLSLCRQYLISFFLRTLTSHDDVPASEGAFVIREKHRAPALEWNS